MTVGEIVLLIGLLINAAAIVLAAWLNNDKFRAVKDELVTATKNMVEEKVDLLIAEHTRGAQEIGMRLYALDNNGVVVLEFPDNGRTCLVTSRGAKEKVTSLVKAALMFLQLKE